MRKILRTVRGVGLRLAVCGGALGAAVAIAGTAAASPAGAAPAPSPAIHRVPCTTQTFTVVYDGSRKVCYEGIGSIRVAIPNVDLVRTGENAGRFVAIKRPGGVFVVTFGPRRVIRFLPQLRVELVFIQITRIAPGPATSHGQAGITHLAGVHPLAA